MTDKISINHSATGNGLDQWHSFTLQIHDNELLDHDAKFQIIRNVVVKDSRPVNSAIIVFEEPFRIDSNSATFRIQLKDLICYDYTGDMISISLIARCIVNDGFIFDTRHSENFSIEFSPELEETTDAELLIQPKDNYNMAHNYRILPFSSKIYIILALLLAIPLVIVNITLGMFAQFTGSSVWIFESDAPAIWSSFSTMVFGVSLWAFIKFQLKKYMSFKFKKLPELISLSTRIAMGEMIKGKSKLMLSDVTLRVVACNIERGQYLRGHGTNTRTVSFKNPFRGIILYEKQVSNIPPKMQIGLFFGGHCDFNKAYSSLYPPQMAGNNSHGVDIYWEVQLIHPDFVDQELVGDSGLFDLKSFYVSGDAKETLIQ